MPIATPVPPDVDNPPTDGPAGEPPASIHAESSDSLTPDERARKAAHGEEKHGYVQHMFSDIAPRYDLLNHMLSLNIDKAWRRKALIALQWPRTPTGKFLDLCAGTLDVGAALTRLRGFAGFVVGADFALPMLQHGAGKAPRKVLAPVAADAMLLPLADASMDGAIVAFGIRNVANLDVALKEVRRILKPGARFVILEFSTPRSRVVRTLYHAYFHNVLPLIGRAVSGHKSAYTYLPLSVAEFPTEQALAARMTAAGFAEVTWQALTFGVAAIHVGVAGATGGAARA